MSHSPFKITPQQSCVSPSLLLLSPRESEAEQRTKVTTEVASTTLRAEQRSGSLPFSLTPSPRTSNYVPPSLLSLDSSSISASSSSSIASDNLAHESSQNPTKSTETSTSSEKSLKYAYVAMKRAYVVDSAGRFKIIDLSDNLISSSRFTPLTVTANAENRSSVSSSLSASSSLPSESSSSSLSSTDSSSLEREDPSRQEMCSILNKIFHANLKI